MPRMFVWRSGLIEIAAATPEGAIEVGSGTTTDLEKWLVYGRLMKDGSIRYLVPGVPEAKTSDDAVDALVRFTKIIHNKMNARPAFKDIEKEISHG